MGIGLGHLDQRLIDKCSWSNSIISWLYCTTTGCTGRKTVIIIDGLDHIGREQNPTRSLSDLPSPEQVPEGVLFVLGSQTDECFPDRIQMATQDPDRRVEMVPLSLAAVHRITRKALGLATLPTALEPVWKHR